MGWLKMVDTVTEALDDLSFLYNHLWALSKNE